MRDKKSHVLMRKAMEDVTSERAVKPRSSLVRHSEVFFLGLNRPEVGVATFDVRSSKTSPFFLMLIWMML